MEISNGIVSWDVVNTRNVNNRKLEIDHSDDSVRHNETINRYLKDEELYHEYKYHSLEHEYEYDANIFDVTSHANHIKSSIYALRTAVVNKFKKQQDIL